MAIAETKLDDSFPNNQFKVKNYTLYRADRNCHGGGLLCFIKSCIPHRIRNDLCQNDNGIESMILEISIRKETWFFIIVYRPPSIHVMYLNTALEKMVEKCQCLGKSVFVMGDLNIDFSKETTPLSGFLETFGMKNMVKGATCFKSVNNPTSVDVILTDSWSRISECINVSNGISDYHNIVCAATKIHAPQIQPRQIIYRTYKNFCDQDFINDLEAAPFHVSNIFDETDDMYWFHNTLLTNIVNEHAPLKKKVVKGNQLPFMNSELRKAINVKNMLRRKFNKIPTDFNWEKFRQLRNKVTTLKRQALKKYFSERCNNNAPKNGKLFWNTIKPFMSNTCKDSGGNITLIENDSVVTDKNTICNIFNEYFINAADALSEDSNTDMYGSLNDIFDVYKEHPSVKCLKQAGLNTEQLHFRQVDSSEVLIKLNKIKTGKTPEYDTIPAKLIKLGANVLSVSLTPIYNESIRSSVFPSELKHAEVAPVFKKSDNMKKGNFRPVSILTCISKIFESLMSDQILQSMQRVLSQYLSAYRMGYSCEHVLVRVIEDWKKALDNGEHVGCVLMDLSKAFDSIPHGLLLSKLNAYGMNFEGCELIRSYLTGRKQRVKLESIRSDWMLLKRGVPQGSILGPLLFNIFINDMFYVINSPCDIYNYADDNSISCHDKDPYYVKQNLEDALDHAINWFKSNYLQANPGKFQFIYISRSGNAGLTVRVDDTQITSESSVKLLGVTIDDDMSFKTHVSSLCKKASGQMKALSRLSSMLSVQSKQDIYNSFIMSNFMYCTTVWHTCNITSARKIEKMQERCLRFVLDDWQNSYSQLLIQSNNCSSYLNRLRNVAKLVFDVLHQKVPMYLEDLFEAHDTRYNLRDNCKVKQQPFKTVKYGFNSLRYQGAKLYNSLPSDIKQNNREDFIKSLKKWDGPGCKCGFCILCNSKNTNG